MRKKRKEKERKCIYSSCALEHVQCFIVSHVESSVLRGGQNCWISAGSA